ncbi:MAG: hypothetical protein AB9897_09775 [Anaerolineaceae bacterium]
MAETMSNPTQMTRMEVKYDFVVNEFPRIRIPSPNKREPENFREMSKLQRQIIVKRLIDHLNEI